MRDRLLTWIGAVLIAATTAAFAQTWPPQNGATLPATCAVGQSFWVTTPSATDHYACTATDTWTNMRIASSGGGVPAGLSAISFAVDCPAGWVEVTAANGKMLLGTLDANADIGGTGGADSITPAGTNTAPTFAGTAFTSVINHTHAVNVTDPTHNHTQNAHTHVVTSQTATTGAATSYEHGTLDTSSAEAEATEVTGSTTATNNAAATGITATTNNPGGGVASITPAGTNSAPTFTGSAFDNRPAFVKVILCQKS